MVGAADRVLRPDPSGPSARLERVRLVFYVYLAVIAAGLAFYIVVGLTHH